MNDELNQFRSEDLLAIARNQSAAMRHEAIRILVERGSEHCGHPDISHEAASVVHSDPRVLKLADPSVHAAGRLPGVLDVLALNIERVGKLEEVSRVIRSDVAALASDSADQRRLTREFLQQLSEVKLDLATAIASESRRLGKLIGAHDERLRLLERSRWQRVKDWWQRMKKRITG